MRMGVVAGGLAIGAGLAYLYGSRAARREGREGGRQLEPRHEIQGSQEREAVASLIDEAVHAPDAPDTPVKQAFEQALDEG